MTHSSQSRVAKMEADDPAVPLDLLVKPLLAMRASRRDLAQVCQATPSLAHLSLRLTPKHCYGSECRGCLLSRPVG